MDMANALLEITTLSVPERIRIVQLILDSMRDVRSVLGTAHYYAVSVIADARQIFLALKRVLQTLCDLS